jgi:seryl-tRNA synthetase
MRFTLEAELEFNNELAPAKAALEKLVSEANSTLLVKGAPAGKESEACRVTDWKAAGRKLSLTLESGRFVRAHDGLVRFRKALAEKLGKEFKLGVRGMKVSHYSVELEREGVPEGLKLPFVQKIERVNAKKIRVAFESLESEVYGNIVDRVLKRLDEKLAKLKAAGSKEKHALVWETGDKKLLYKEDPSGELEKRGWVKRYEPGIWFFLAPYMRLHRAISDLVVEQVALPLGFEEIGLPKLVPLRVMRKKGQLTGIPHEMFYVSPPKARDEKEFEEYADRVAVTGEEAPEKLREHLRPPEYCLPYAQCEPFYELFGGEIVDAARLPLKYFDRTGFSFRWEAGGIKGLERFNQFTRIELSWLAQPDECAAIRDQVIERYRHLFDKLLDLEVRAAEVTPVWMAHSGAQPSEKEARVPATIDLEAYMPFRGHREKCEWLEIGNSSVNFSKYLEWYGVKEKQERELWFGCSGQGIERIVFSLLAQKGFDPDKWPKALRERVLPFPEPPKLVTWPK